MGVAYAHNPGVCMPCGAWPTSRTWWRVFLEEVPPDVLPPLLPGVCVVVGGGVGDDNGLPWGGTRMHPHRCRRWLRGYADGVGGGCCYGVSLRWCDGGIPLDGEEEVVAVRW